MIESIIEIRRLDPSMGMKLTNGTVIAENEVYLAINDSKENWYEITEAEAEELQNAKVEQAEELLPY